MAVDRLSLEINDGEVFGILGPNGAGKTTFFRLLSCLLKPSAGTAELSGYDIVREPMRVRERVGLLCEEPSLYDRQSVRDNLELFGELYGLDKIRTKDRIQELARSLDFQNLLEKNAGTLSKGQRQRISLARALLHEPEVLLLDEPTANLDPETAENVRDSIKDLQKDQKRTILVNSHNLDEIQRICERVAIIDDGRIVESGSIRNLSDKLWTGKRVSIILKADRALEKQAWLRDIEKQFPKITSVTLVPEFSEEGLGDTKTNLDSHTAPHYRLEIILSNSASDEEKEDVTSGAIKIITATTDLKITSVETAKHSLQEVYLKLLRDKRDDEEQDSKNLDVS